MVTSLANPTAPPDQHRPLEVATRPANGGSTTARLACPRCRAQLIIGYDDLECFQCGYVDYEYSSPHGAAPRRSVLSTATCHIVRYVGEFPVLADTLTYVKLERVRNRVVYRVNCPFCGGAMDQSSLSGKRRELREERYKCLHGHRVSLTPAKHGGLGWK